jgi:predicted dienelactone hydrolase
MNPFDYHHGAGNFELQLVRSGPLHEVFKVSFTTAAVPRLIGTDTVSAEYYRPKTLHPTPLLILLHGMGRTSVIPPTLIAGSLADSGIACFVPRLVVHPSRTPKLGTGKRHLSPEEWFDTYRVSVIETRQIIDWAQNRKEVDPARIGVLGISFGAFAATIAMGRDKRVSAGVLIECGGNSININRTSSAMRSRYPGPALDHDKLLAEYKSFLDEVARVGFDRAEPAHQTFLSDPLTYAEALKGRPLLMINAKSDELIPPESARDLWNATGRGTILWLPGMHITVWIWYRTISRRVETFLASAFGMDK